MQPKTPLFTSDSQHPPRFGHAVYLGDDTFIDDLEQNEAIYYYCNLNLKNNKINSKFTCVCEQTVILLVCDCFVDSNDFNI